MRTVRNVPDELHRALCTRASLRGRSIEADMHAVLEETVLPEGRAAPGSLLAAIGRSAGRTGEEFASFAQRDTSSARPIDLE